MKSQFKLQISPSFWQSKWPGWFVHSASIPATFSSSTMHFCDPKLLSERAKFGKWLRPLIAPDHSCSQSTPYCATDGPLSVAVEGSEASPAGWHVGLWSEKWASSFSAMWGILEEPFCETTWLTSKEPVLFSSLKVTFWFVLHTSSRVHCTGEVDWHSALSRIICYPRPAISIIPLCSPWTRYYHHPHSWIPFCWHYLPPYFLLIPLKTCLHPIKLKPSFESSKEDDEDILFS